MIKNFVAIATFPRFPFQSVSFRVFILTDILFFSLGRPVRNMKKFEEGVFSDLRNLKPGHDACLEEPKVSFHLINQSILHFLASFSITVFSTRFLYFPASIPLCHLYHFIFFPHHIPWYH